MVKKIVSLFLLTILLFCLSACEEKNNSSTTIITQENESILNSSDSEFGYESEITSSAEVRLSDICDKVLAKGIDKDGNSYELVANEQEDYNGMKTEVGVIKNNKWLVPLTNEMPFIGYDNKLIAKKFDYIGKGCFVNTRYSDLSLCTVYNAENGLFFDGDSDKVKDLEGYRHPGIVSSDIDDYYIIGKDDNQAIYLLNKNTMELKSISIPREINGKSTFIQELSNISENLFCIATATSSPYHRNYYFFDINGKLIIDLSKYYIEAQQNLYFKEGKCTLQIENNNGTDYYITIDKTGNVINSTPA